MRTADEAHTSSNHVLNTFFSPLQLGRFRLSHRVVLAPLTRCRALNYVPQPAHVDYYSQRTTPGGLLITEAVAVAQEGIGFPHSPGIFTTEQIDAWRPVVDAVHEKGGTIFCQLWHVGRASHTFYQPDDASPVSSTSSKVPDGWYLRLPEGKQQGFSNPRALKPSEVPIIVQQFREAARNAAMAGFDGVEIHAAHGYLIDQFLKDGINDRLDEYGGSIENRCKLCLQIVLAITEEIGSDRVGVRISPVIDHIGANDSNPIGLGLYLVEQMNKLDLAYLHVTEPRFTSMGIKDTSENTLALRKAYKGTYISSGGYTRESGTLAIRENYADLIAYGRLFISNPDLPVRFALNANLNKYDKSTFYTHDQVKGYIDYPFLNVKDMKEMEGQAAWKNCGRTEQVWMDRRRLLRAAGDLLAADRS